jgi:hypothetical protein
MAISFVVYKTIVFALEEKKKHAASFNQEFIDGLN